MTGQILGSLAAGILCGLVLKIENGALLGSLTSWALAALLFTIGFSLGEDRELWSKVRGLPKISLGVPFLIAAGSISGAALVGWLCGLSPGEGALVGAGFGWYSFSGVLIAQSFDVSLGTLALLTNVFRESLALVLTPIVAKRLGKTAAVAPGGATAMDVTLPIIAANTDGQTAILAIYSGTVLSALVPVIIPLLIQMLQR